MKTYDGDHEMNSNVINGRSNVQSKTGDLLPVFSGFLGGDQVKLVDARALYVFMQVRRDFATWIKARILKFGFVVGEDYLTAKSGEQLDSPDLVNQVSRHGGDRRSIDYHLTLDMAKELAMVENNERGRQARRYFIECEKRLQQIAPSDAETIQGQTIGTDGFHCLAAVVDGKAKRLPAALRRGAKNHLWSQVHKAFSVVTAEDIPASQLDAARNFVAAYALEGEWLGRDALEGFGGLIGKKLKGAERWLVSVDHTGQEQYTPVPENASVLSYEDLIAGMVSTRGDIPVSTDEMFEFVMAALTNIKCRSDHMRHMLRMQRTSH